MQGLEGGRGSPADSGRNRTRREETNDRVFDRRAGETFRPVAALDSLKSETFCRDLKFFVNRTVERSAATAPATVLSLSVPDAEDRPN